MINKYFIFIVGILLIGMISSVSANMPREISETEFNNLVSENKNCVFQQEHNVFDEINKKIKGEQFENRIDLMCILVKAKADKIKVELLEQKITTLEQKVADLENIIYNTKGTQIETTIQPTTKMWWEFWK